MEARKRGKLVLPLVYTAFCLFYFWTIKSSGTRFRFGKRQDDFYNQLTDGFLHGTLSIPAQVPKALLLLKDPYIPSVNARFGQFHDLALYHGHFYLTWGPTPVVTLFLPWRLLHVGAIPESFAVWIYCSAGLAFALLLVEFLASHYFRSVRSWQLAIAAVAVGSSSIAPFLLRSPVVYEVNISSSYCFAMAGLYFLSTGTLSAEIRLSRLVVGSLCCGLAAGGHEDDVLLGIVVLAIFVIAWRLRGFPRFRLGVILFGPFVAVMALLLFYNYARFGSPLNVGTPYELAGYDPQTVSFYRFGYLAPNLYYYVIAPVRWLVSFPFFQLPPPPSYPGVIPATYSTQIVSGSTEVIGGILTTTPILLSLVALPSLMRRKRLGPELLGLIIAMVLTGIVIVVFVSFSVPGASYRYETDFATLLIIPAIVSWFALSEGSLHTGRQRHRLAKSLGGLAIVYGALVGIGVSMTGYYNNFPTYYPELETSDASAYWAFDEATSPIPTLYALIAGRPVLTKVTSPLGVSSQVGFFDAGAGRNLFFYLGPTATDVEVVSPRSENAVLRGGFGIGPGLPRGDSAVVSVTANGVSHQFLVGSQATDIAVRLHTGLNRITLIARAESRSHVASTAALVQVYQLVVNKAF